MKLKWPIFHTVPHLHKNEIHVWAVELDRFPAEIEKLAHNLILEEKERADRFHFARDRDHYIVGRAVLRRLLGSYLEVPPKFIDILYSDYGKPYLMNSGLDFNISHSHGLGLFAFCRETDVFETAVGVDIERIRPMPDADDLVTHYFSQAEIAKWQTVPPQQTAQAFFNCWTRKEAFIKAIGEGLSHPLDAFDVTFLPNEPVQFLWIAGRNKDDYALLTLEPATGFVGALTYSASSDYKVVKMSKGEL